jgi:hypothetical protein
MIELLIIGASFILAAVLVFIVYSIGLAHGKLQAVRTLRQTAEKYKTLLEKLYAEPRDTFGYPEETVRMYMKVRAYSQERLDALKKYPSILEIHPGEVDLHLDYSRERHKGKSKSVDKNQVENVTSATVEELDELSQMVDEAQPFPRKFRKRQRTH